MEIDLDEARQNFKQKQPATNKQHNFNLLSLVYERSSLKGPFIVTMLVTSKG